MMLKIKDVRGFTLIELMTIIALLAVISTMAVPNFIQFIRNNQVQSKADELVKFLQYARSQAIVNRQAYEVDLSSNDEWLVSKVEESVDPDPIDDKRTLSFNTAQAQPRTTTLTDNKLIYRANGTVLESARITVCRDNDYANGYQIEIKPGGSILIYARGRKTDTAAMSTCTPI